MCQTNKKIKRLTYFTINDPDEAVAIKDAKDSCGNFCVGANLSDTEEENDYTGKSQNQMENFNVQEETNDENPSKLKVAFFWICGIESSLNTDKNVNIVPEYKVDVSIDQNKFWAHFCDLNAVFAIALMSFGFAFLNKFD